MATIPLVPCTLGAGVATDVTCDQLVDLFWFYGAAASVFPHACKIRNDCQSNVHAEDVSESLQESPLNVHGYICPSGPQASILSEHPGECHQPSHANQPCANIDIAQQCTHSVSSMRWLRRVFDTFDENKDGLLSLEELRRSLEKLGLESSDVQCLLRGSPVSASGQKGAVSQDEFLLLYHGVSCTQCVPDHASNHGDADSMDNNKDDAEEDLIWDAFNVFDKDKDGFISPMELQSVLCGLGFGSGRELDACIEMIRGYDQDGNGQVDFEEFKDMLNSAIKLN